MTVQDYQAQYGKGVSPSSTPQPSEPLPAKSPKPQKYPNISMPEQEIRFIPLGTIPSAKFQEVMREINKVWAAEVAPLLEEKKSFKDQFRSDITNAAYRISSKQLLVLTKNLFLSYIRKHCNEESKIRSFSELLDTEIGMALTAMFIGMAVSQIPQLSNNPKMLRILKEFRVSGMADLGNAAFESLLESVLPIIVSSLHHIENTENVEKSIPNLLEQELIFDDIPNNSKTQRVL